MRKSKFTDEQKKKIVEETLEKPTKEVAKTHGITVQTINNWQTKLIIMEYNEMQ